MTKRERKPLESYFFDDSTRTNVMFAWNVSMMRNEINMIDIDTAINSLQMSYPFLRNGVGEVREVDADASIAWIGGRFYFDGAPLSDIARQMERWYDISIVFAGDDMSGECFTGVIDRSNTANDVMHTLEKIAGLQYDIRDRTIVIF